MTLDEIHSRQLIKSFGTDNIYEILGEEVLNFKRTIRDRLSHDFDMEPKATARWAKTYIPADLYASLKPKQRAIGNNLSPEKRASIISKHKATLSNTPQTIFSARSHKAKLTYFNTHGKTSVNSLTEEQLLSRLADQNLSLDQEFEPMSSLKYSEIKVKCNVCGTSFKTHLVTGSRLHHLLFKCCECQQHSTHFQNFIRDYIREHYYSSAHQWSSIPWMSNKEIDIFIPSLILGLKLMVMLPIVLLKTFSTHLIQRINFIINISPTAV